MLSESVHEPMTADDDEDERAEPRSGRSAGGCPVRAGAVALSVDRIRLPLSWRKKSEGMTSSSELILLLIELPLPKETDEILIAVLDHFRSFLQC